MAGADKRAKLLSDLLAAKGGAAPDARPAAPERAAVIPIAPRRASEDRASEMQAAPGVLYSKGAATASTFRPSYWSFDHQESADTIVEPAKVEAAPVAPAIANAPAAVPARKPMPVNFVVAFGCVALVLSTTLFVLSVWHPGDVSAASPEPAAVAAAPAPAALVVPIPPQAPAEIAAAPAAPPVAPASSTAPAPPPVVAPPPVPAVSEPVANDPPPPTAAPPTEPAAAPSPTPAATPTPAAGPAVAAAPAPAPASASAPTPASPEADALLARGDDLLATGDVAAARLFYQRAAEQGSAAAATAVGQTYDPGVLEVLRVRGQRGDPQVAAEWYRKAIEAGDRQAEIRLKRLLARTGG